MRLADFITTHTEPILKEWESFARGIAVGEMGTAELRDHAINILRATVRDMKSIQTDAEQLDKSKGEGDAGTASTRLDEASELHGIDRVESGFDLMHVVSEYRALRASVLRLWHENTPEAEPDDLEDLIRFNESIDQSLGKSVQSYTERVDRSRRMFLAILGHDLRNPLTSILMSAELVTEQESQARVSQIIASAKVIGGLVKDLIDFAGTGLGDAMPLSPVEVDLGVLCREVVEEFKASSPGSKIQLDATGDLCGSWDAARMRQVVTNLVGNAIQHGNPEGLVELIARPEGSHVVIAVHNDGAPIPDALLRTIFDPLVRGISTSGHRRAGSIGLGLYIAREIVQAHGGAIGVISSEEGGTLFTVRVPRWRAGGGAKEKGLTWPVPRVTCT